MSARSIDEYLRQSEHAVRHLYAGLDSCWLYYQQALKHWDISKVGERMTPERQAALQEYLRLADRYFDLKFSEALFAGSILQTAAVAIRLFSTSSAVPPSCAAIVPTKAKGAIPFCIGRELHGIPIGLIVYAARNQYNHWEEEPFPASRAVFDHLAVAFHDNALFDLAMDLTNPTIDIYANEVLLGVLGWTTYDRYDAEVRGMLRAA